MRLLFTIMLSLSLFSCTSNDPVRIGFVAALTGQQSDIGVSARNGAQLACDVVNAAGGVRGQMLVLEPVDISQDLKEALTQMSKLLDSGVTAVVGPVFSSMAQVSVEVSGKYGIPFVSPTVATGLVKEQDDWFFRVIPVLDTRGADIAKQALAQGNSKFAIVVDESNKAYAFPLMKHFSETVEKSGNGTVVKTWSILPANTSFPVLAKEIIDTGADAVYFVMDSFSLAQMAQQLRKAGSDAQLFSARWGKTGELLQQGGTAVEGMVLDSAYIPPAPSDAFVTFQDKYEKKFGSHPGFGAAYGYEAVMVLAEAMNKGGFDAEDIKKSILKIGSFKGIESDFVIDAYGDAVRPSSMVRIKGGAYTLIPEK